MKNPFVRHAVMTYAAKPCYARQNYQTAEIVDKGIALQTACGTQSAAEFLKGKMVGLEVAARVLADPSKRRRQLK